MVYSLKYKVMISRHEKTYVAIGIAFIIISILCALIIKPNVAPEFSGSALLTVEFAEEQNSQVVVSRIEELVDYDIEVNHLSGTEFTIAAHALSAEEYEVLRKNMEEVVGEYEVKEYQSFSPSISTELLYKAVMALIVAIIIIILYISYVFRKSSRPVSSWKYGVAATVALIHDAVIPIGLFSIIAPFTTASVDTLFVTALLATLGYSINDTIVVFDRMRDRLQMNKSKNVKESFADTVNYGVRYSLRRSVYTSASTAIPLILLFIFVEATQWFSVALFTGIIAGTYSSLFFAPSLLLLWQEWFPQKDGREKHLSETEAAEKMLRETVYNDDIL